MHKSLTYKRNTFGSKGQWFIISAIIVSSSLLTISVLFKSFSSVDTSKSFQIEEDYLAQSIENAFNSTIISNGYDQPNCVNLNRELNEFVIFSRRKLAESGYLLDIKYDVNCLNRKTDFNIFIASDKLNITRTIRF